MTISRQARIALRAWLGPSTWHKEHPLDKARFYQFVRVFCMRRRAIDETAFRQLIIREASRIHGEVHHAQQAAVSRRVREAVIIFEFLRARQTLAS